MAFDYKDKIITRLRESIDFEIYTPQDVICLLVDGKNVYLSMNKRSTFFLIGEEALSVYHDFCNIQESGENSEADNTSRELELLCSMDAIRIIFYSGYENDEATLYNKSEYIEKWKNPFPMYRRYRDDGGEQLLWPDTSSFEYKCFVAADLALHLLGGVLPGQYLFRKGMDIETHLLTFNLTKKELLCLEAPQFYIRRTFPILESFDEFTAVKLMAHRSPDSFLFDVYYMSKLHRSQTYNEAGEGHTEYRHVNIIALCSINHNTLVDLRSQWNYTTHLDEVKAVLKQIFSKSGVPKAIYVMNERTYELLSLLSNQLGFELYLQDPISDYLKLRGEFERQCLALMEGSRN